MNKKNPLSILFLLVAIFASAQSSSLEFKIPADSQVVASVNGERTLELLTLMEFEKSTTGETFLKELNRNSDSPIQSIKDLGFKLNSKAYYFYRANDSISTHNLIVELDNRNNFEKQVFKNDAEDIESINGIRILQKHSTIYVWNNDFLVMSTGKISASYFDKIADRIDQQNKKETVKVEVVVVKEKVEEAAEIESTEIEETVIEEVEEEVESVIESTEIEEVVVEVAKEKAESSWDVKRRLKKEWTRAQALQLLTQSPQNSILTNKSYLKSRNSKASASLWLNNYGDLMTIFLKDAFRNFPNSSISSTKGIFGMKSFNANLFFNEKDVELKTTLSLNKEWSKAYKEIYNKKFNKKFFKYFNQDNALAYVNLTLSTEGLLNTYPNLMATTYEGILPAYSEETRIAVELFNIILDEEAIDDLIGGDFLFVLNDIKQKEVSYVSYDYDDNYKRTEVTKTKKEFVPEFTLMIGSKNEQFMKKLIRLGVKHHLVDNLNSYYSIVTPKKLPVDVFVGIKDKIVFLTTSEEQIKQIMNGSFISNVGKHKRALAKNSMTIYINGTGISKRIPKEMLPSDNGLKRLIANINTHNLEMQLSTSKIRKNQIHTNLIINTPEAKKNSLHYFFDILNQIFNKQ